VKTNDDPRSFSNKPALARAAVLAAGVTFNAISAVIVFMIVFMIGMGLRPGSRQLGARVARGEGGP